MKRYLSPMGFTPHLVTRPIIANGISRGDRVEVIRPEQPDASTEERAVNAIDDIRSTLSGVVSNVDLDVKIITHSEFEKVVDRCSEIIMDGPKPVICFGAGATDIHFPMTIAACGHRNHIASIMMYSDLKMTAAEIAVPPFPMNVPGRTRNTLKALGEAPNNESSIADISDRTDVDRTTVGRHLRKLEQLDLITTHTRKKSKVATLTTTGRMMTRNMEKG